MPIYSMLYWQLSHVGESRIEYRPSGKTVLDRLGISTIAAFVLATSIWLVGWPWSPAANDWKVQRPTDVELAAAAELKSTTDELKRLLPPEKVAELERVERLRRIEREEALARLQSQRSLFTGVGRCFHWFAFVVLAAVTVIPLIALPVQKVVIEKSPQAELVVRKSGLWQSTRRWPSKAFTQIVYGVEEERRRLRSISYTVGWRWLVKLRGGAPFSIENEATKIDDMEVAFYVDRQRQKPAATDQPPEIVSGMAAALGRLTGATVDIDRCGGDAFNRRQILTKTSMQPMVTREVSIPWDELPEDLRRKANELRAKGEIGPTLIGESVRVTVRDADGNERTYNSLDELPDELRTEHEQIIRSARRDNRTL